MASERADSSANLLLDLVEGHRVAIVYVAARLGIADVLLDGPKSASDLAQLTNSHEPSLSRLMRALVKLASCRQASDSKFGLTETGNYLAAGSESSMKAWALFEGATEKWLE